MRTKEQIEEMKRTGVYPEKYVVTPDIAETEFCAGCGYRPRVCCCFRERKGNRTAKAIEDMIEEFPKIPKGYQWPD